METPEPKPDVYQFQWTNRAGNALSWPPTANWGTTAAQRVYGTQDTNDTDIRLSRRHANIPETALSLADDELAGEARSTSVQCGLRLGRWPSDPSVSQSIGTVEGRGSVDTLSGEALDISNPRTNRCACGWAGSLERYMYFRTVLLVLYTIQTVRFDGVATSLSVWDVQSFVKPSIDAQSDAFGDLEASQDRRYFLVLVVYLWGAKWCNTSGYMVLVLVVRPCR